MCIDGKRLGDLGAFGVGLVKSEHLQDTPHVHPFHMIRFQYRCCLNPETVSNSSNVAKSSLYLHPA